MSEEFAQTNRQSMLIGAEASPRVMPGIPVASKIPVINPSMKPEVSDFTPQALTGTPETRGTEQGKKKITIDVELETNPSSAIAVLPMMYGPGRKHGTAALWTRDYWLDDVGTFFVEQQHTDFGKFILSNYVRFGQHSVELAPEGFQSMKFAGLGARISPTNAASAVTADHITDRTTFRPFSHMRIRTLQGGQVMGIVKKLTFDVNRNIGSDVAMDETDEQSQIFTTPAVGKGTMSAQFANNPVTGYSAAELRDRTLDPDNQTVIEAFIPYGKGWGMWIRVPAAKFKPGYVSGGQANGIVTLDTEFAMEPFGSLRPELRSLWFTNLGATIAGKTINVHTNEVNGGGGAGTHAVVFGATAGDYDTPQKVADYIEAHAATVDVFVERKAGDVGACVVLKPKADAVGGDDGATDIRIATAGSDGAAVLGYEVGATNADGIAALANGSIVWTVMSGIAA